MAFDELFTFVSGEERKKKLAEYENKIFPFGADQKKTVLNVLKPLMGKRIKDTDILYSFVSSKQKYMEAETDAIQVMQKSLRKFKLLNETEQKYILSLILLEKDAVSLEEYPTTNDVVTHAGD